MIIDTLFNRGYLDGKSIQATPLGMQLIESLEKYSPIIIDENLTRQLEEEMEKIQTSKSNFLNQDLRSPQRGAPQQSEEARSKSESEIREFYEEKEREIIQKAERLITDISKEFKSKETQIGKDIMKGIESHREQERENNTITL